MIFEALSCIGRKLNDAGVAWAVGASMLLHDYGLVDKPNDIDILVALNDIEKADRTLKSMGEKKPWEKAAAYSTRYFYEYVINSFDVDVMAGLRINYSHGIFEYIFDSSSITGSKEINGVNIPLTALEDWYVIYQLIPGREAKVKMIEEYLLSHGIKNPALLERALKSDLPKEARHKIEGILAYGLLEA